MQESIYSPNFVIKLHEKQSFQLPISKARSSLLFYSDEVNWIARFRRCFVKAMQAIFKSNLDEVAREIGSWAFYYSKNYAKEIVEQGIFYLLPLLSCPAKSSRGTRYFFHKKDFVTAR